MSIQIGVNARTSSTSLTNNERIFLQSSVHSNMITLKSTLPESRVWFDDDLTFGRSNTSLVFSKQDAPFALFHPNEVLLKSPVVATQPAQFQKQVTIDSNVVVGQSVRAPSLQTSNVAITASSTNTTTPLLALYTQNQTPLLTSTAAGTTYFGGSVGIGTSMPTTSFQVIGNGRFSGSLASSNIATQRILSSSENNNIEIDLTTLSNIQLKGHVIISETLTVIGGISQQITELDYLYINNGLSSPFISLSNIAQNSHTIELYHDISSTPTPCNIMHITNYDGIQGSDILTLTPTGALGIGTDDPIATVDVNYNLAQGKPNILSLKGVNTRAAIVVDKNANVGLGTTVPMHNLHIVRTANSTVAVEPMMALYNEPTPFNAPLFVAYSNQSPVFQVAENGSTTIGNMVADSNWGLAVPSIKTAWLQTDAIVASPEGGCNIHMFESHLSNVGDYFGRNMTVTEFVSTSNLRTNFFFSSNFEIPGLEVFNNANHFSINMASMIHRGSNIVFSPDDSDIYRDPRIHGKVRVYAPDGVTGDDSVIGLNVIGNSNTISQVTSILQPIFKLVQSNVAQQDFTEVAMKLENRAFRLTHSRTNANVLPIQVNDKGTLFYRNVFIDNLGRFGIKLGGTDANPTSPDYPFHMRGTAYFQTDTSTPLLFLNGGTGHLGVNTINPSYTMHVEGSSFVRNDLIARGTTFLGASTPSSSAYTLYADGSQLTTSNSIIVGNVGVGTTNPRFKLDVWGNLNFQGDIYQRGSAYISSQWTTNGRNIFISNSNVGIGTSSPFTSLDVRGTILGSNVGIGTTLPLQSFHVQQGSFFSGNVGMGTTVPLGSLHVQSGRIILPSSVGVGTTTPLGSLHVQSGNVLLSSNVGVGTTNPLGSLHVAGGTIILPASVGIGTTAPQFPLHVQGNLNFDGNLFQNGTPYISSQWTTTTTPAGVGIYINSNVGIGSTLPMYGLHVEGTAYFSSNVSINGLLSTRGNIASVSDQRYKTNLAPITEPMDRILHLTGYTYDRIDLGQRECGLIAQDVEKVLPEVVYKQGETGILTISYGNLAALFVEGMKELQAKVHALESEVAQLRAERS